MQMNGSSLPHEKDTEHVFIPRAVKHLEIAGMSRISLEGLTHLEDINLHYAKVGFGLVVRSQATPCLSICHACRAMCAGSTDLITFLLH